MNTTKVLFLLALGMALSFSACTPSPARQETQEALSWGQFEAELEDLRLLLKIPGMSAAVVQDGKLAWTHGFGYADLENQLPAAPETPYHLASVTKTFAAVIVMQLVQEGKLSLDDPVSHYGVNLPEGEGVTLRHLMSHTSEGVPGERYRYNGTRYGLLSQVVLAATGKTLQEWVYERIFQPLGMQDTAPSPPVSCAGLSFAADCERVFDSLSKLYYLDADFNPVPGFNQDNFNAGAGLISTVLDLAKFDAALDADTLVSAATKELMWTPGTSNAGEKLPYGLGWFTQNYQDQRLIWHYGYSPPSTSALFFKLPDEGLTFILLANSDLLSRPVPWDESDVLTSLPALAFYKRFIMAPQASEPLPAIDWTADHTTVIGAINAVKDEALRDLLSRELIARGRLVEVFSDLKVANQRLEQMRAEAEEIGASLDPQALEPCVGDYQFADLGGATLSLTRSENRLFLSGISPEPLTLLPLSPTRFFIPSGYDYYQFDCSPEEQGGSPARLDLFYYGMTFTGWRK